MKPVKQKKSNYLSLYYLTIGIVLSAIATLLVLMFGDGYYNSSNYQYSNEIQPPMFSKPGGIFDTSFDLEIQSSPGTITYYTIDGSRPTVSSRKYKQPITIGTFLKANNLILHTPTSPIWRPPLGNQKHGVLVRAVNYQPGFGYSRVTSGVYYPSETLDHTGFKIVNIISDPDSLFSPLRGIYVLGEQYYSKKRMIEDRRPLTRQWWEYSANYHQRGNNWEREGTLILMNNNGEILLNQDIGIRINGQATRAYPQKSLRIIADEKYGNGYINYDLFEQHHTNKFKRLILRNSGNDWDRTLFRDALIQQLSIGTNSDLQAYTPAIVYINGNYWGIHNIRERQDEFYLSEKYQTELHNISMLRSPTNVYYGEPDAGSSLSGLIEFINTNSLNDIKNYETAIKSIDIQHFIDYLIIETFFVNTDWPHNNTKIYKFHQQNDLMESLNIASGKWRWMIYDLDYGFNYTGDKSHNTNMFDHIHRRKGSAIGTIFYGLMENDQFRQQFHYRYTELINNYYNSDRVLNKIEAYKALYETEIDRQIARWRKPNNKNRWLQEIENMRTFARQRPTIALKHLEQLLEEYENNAEIIYSKQK